MRKELAERLLRFLFGALMSLSVIGGGVVIAGCGSGTGFIDDGSGSGASASLESAKADVFSLVNSERANNGRSALARNATLDQVAYYHCLDMRGTGTLSHTGSDGSSVADRVNRAGVSYATVGENVAQGQTTATQVMNAWMNSAGHRANILNPVFTEIGIGVATPGYWWTQVFIGN